MLWIGCLESDEEFLSKVSKGYDLASAQYTQKNLLRGLEAASGILFDTINGSVLPPYPVYSDRVIQPVCWHRHEGTHDVSVGYVNDRYVNRLYCSQAMLAAAKDWVEQRYQGGELIVFAYSMRSAPMATACYIQRVIPQARLFLIVTDLPQFMDLGQSRVKAALKWVDGLSIRRMRRQFDGFVLYAASMAEHMHLPDEKWLLMEGALDAEENSSPPSALRKKAVMYAGKLERQYGLPLLVDAFMGIQRQDVELWITGSGNAAAYIRACAQKDSRIRFYGFLPDRADVLRLQRAASLLVNMRLPSEPSSRYSFPSKLLEYMATGVPVLSFHLEGIPAEYLPHLCLFDAETPDSIRQTLERCLDMDAALLAKKGAAAKRFVTEQKNVHAQCQRIHAFVTRIAEAGSPS